MKIPLTETLTPLELNHGESVSLTNREERQWQIRLLETSAEVLFTTLPEPGVEYHSAVTFYAFQATIEVNGERHCLKREVPTWRSFYEPWEIAGLTIWLDAVEDIFRFLIEEHGPCRPRKHARLAVQESGVRICPEPVHTWCPLHRGGLLIHECYTGEDCWMGPYFGVSAHAGLDINHPAGTPIWAPLAIDDQAYFNSLAAGHNNNRWRGWRKWPDGRTWILQCHHMTHLTVDEHVPLQAGQHYASGAGVHSGTHEHSHFAFKIVREGIEYPLDPWILFRQMYRDRDAGLTQWEVWGRNRYRSIPPQGE